jgi:tryptophan synthase alpha chain
LVARTGVTGKQTELADSLSDIVSQIRRFTDLPVAVGFGIRSRSDVERVWEFAEGAVVGSALVEFIEKNCHHADLPERVAAYVEASLLPSR